LIELPTWLGDAVMVTPAIENIVNFHNDVEITLIGSFVSIEALKKHPKIIKTVVLSKKYTDLYQISRKLGSFDVFFSFRSSVRSKFLKFLISAKNKYQFDKNKYKNSHQVEKYNDFVNDSFLIDLTAGNLKIYGYEVVKSKEKMLGINPGASYGSAKRWYPEKFAKVAVSLSGEYKIVIFGGPDEVDIANDIEQGLVSNNVKNYKNIAGNTTITELIDQISNLDLFITGDSGPMHVAAAFQIPTVAIFGPTKDNETSQWRNTDGIVVKKNLECQPCMQRICSLEHHNCMKYVKSSDVLNAIKSIE